jgi:succinate dehydrogenase/fumarate reductase flavoprotein subunit
MISGEYDVVVVGAGNAGMCAALAARENGRAGAGARSGAVRRARRQFALYRRRAALCL